jgi:hypothetical protein
MAMAAPFPAGVVAGGRGRHSGASSFPGSGFTGSSFTGSAGPAGSGSAIPVGGFPRTGPWDPAAEPPGPAGGSTGAGGFGDSYGGSGFATGPGAGAGGWGAADPSDTDVGGFGADARGGEFGGDGPGGGFGGTASGGAGAAAAGSAATRFIGSHRLGVPRTPRITGSPPWEPAPEPAGDVPWSLPTAGATPLGPGQPPGLMEMPLPAPPEPEQTPWDLVAQEVWPGGPSTPRPVAPADGPFNGAGDWADEPGPDQPGPEADGSRPIYVWNPGESTESFPIMPPGDPNRP